MTQTKGVRTLHPDYARALPLWERCEAAAEGEHAIHAAGVTYLPRLIEETDPEYKARLNRTPFFNATWRTISGLKGMMFRKDPVPEVPAGIEEYLADIDMAGTTLDQLAQEVCEQLLTVGRVGVLVDHPPKLDDSTVTVAQAQSMGLRPMAQLYPCKSIRNWKTARINGVMQTTLLVLSESAALDGDDEFAQKTEDRYRVLDLFEGKYRQRVFAIRDEKDVQISGDIFPLMNNKNLDYIPFVFFGVDSNSADVESPPLLDLVDMNIHHYQVSADWEHACHFSGLPTLFITGYNPPDDAKKLYIGGSSANVLPDPMAKAFYVETGGSFFSPLTNNLTEKKAEMAVLGARMLESQKSAVESAETLHQRSAGEQSQLAGMAAVVSAAITKVLTLFADWAGVSGTISYELSRDFVPAGLTAQELTALVASWQAGAISQQVLFENLQRGEVINSETTFEDEQERIASSPPIALTAPEDEGQNPGN